MHSIHSNISISSFMHQYEKPNRHLISLCCHSSNGNISRNLQHTNSQSRLFLERWLQDKHGMVWGITTILRMAMALERQRPDKQTLLKMVVTLVRNRVLLEQPLNIVQRLRAVNKLYCKFQPIFFFFLFHKSYDTALK